MLPPLRMNGTNQISCRRTEEIQNAVGAGALDSPLYIKVFSGRRRRRPLPRLRKFVYLCAAKGLCEQRCGQPRTSVPTGFERDRLFGAPPRDCANKDRDYSSVIDSHLRLVNATFPHKGRLWLCANNLRIRRGNSRIARRCKQTARTNHHGEMPNNILRL